MKKNKVPLQGMADLFNHLKSSEADGLEIQFFSSHPLIKSRIKEAEREAVADIGPVILHPELEQIFSEMRESL